MRRVFLASVMSLAALPAFAADLPARTAPVAPAPIMASPVYNWTGFYVGANAGYAWGSGDVNLVGNAVVLDAFGPLGASLDPGGFTLGAQIGYNYQINQFVLGVEADANWIDASESAVANPFTGVVTSAGSEINWLSTIRGRIGWAANNFLIYGTGGVAVGNAKATWGLTVDGEGTTTWTGSQSGTRWGWTLGAGVEYAFNRNWTAKVEYLYYDLGDKTFYSNTVDTAQAIVKADYTGNIIRAGVNYKF